jgi:hypothetical protein
MNVTVSPDPGDDTSVTFQVDGLTISRAEPTSSGTAVFSIATVVAVNNSLWDATLQIGSNTPVEAEVQVVESNGSQTIGVTLTDSEVTYCSPTSTGGGGTVTEVTGVTPISVANGTTTPAVSLDNDGITTAKIADDAVTSPKIADDAVTHGKIANLAVEHGKIGLGAVQTTNINDDAVTADKLADTAVTPGSYTTADITVDAQGRITSASTGSPPAGTVTSVTAGSGLTGGTITSSGTIAHGPGTFIGSEEYPVKIVVDSFGHIQVNESESTAGAYRTAVGADDASNLTTGTVAVTRGGTGSNTSPMISVVTAADAAAARTVLNLGTAATEDVGTSGQNIVQLDNAARLPAVDGSQLTNLPSSGGGNAWGGGNPDATTVRYFDDMMYLGPDDITGNAHGTFLQIGSSGVAYKSASIAGAMACVHINIDGQYDRANWWGPTLFHTSDLANGHEILLEARGRIDNTNSAEDLMTSFTVGFMQWETPFGENGSPPNTFYSSGKHACMRHANPYSTDTHAYTNVVGFVKDTAGSTAGASVVDSTTITNASVLNDWVRLAVKMVYDSTNSRWDITGYVDGTLRWNDSRTLTQESNKALLPIISLSGGGRGGTGNMETYLDWVSLQFKRPSATSYLSI